MATPPRKRRATLICGLFVFLLGGSLVPARAFEINLGVFLTAKKGEGIFLWPLYEHNAERNLWALRPLFSSENGRLSILWPIFATGWDDEGHLRNTRLFPFFWGHDDRGFYFAAVPLYWNMVSKPDTSCFALGPVVRYRRGPRTFDGLFPFFVSRNPETDSKSVSVFPFYWARSGGELNTFHIIPFYWWKKDRCFSIFPLYGWYQWADPERGRLNYVLWPLYTRAQKPTETKWSILRILAYGVQGDERRGYGLGPLFGSMTSLEQSETLWHQKSYDYYLFPFFWALSEEKARRELSVQDKPYDLIYKKTRHVFFPLFWWSEVRKGDAATDDVRSSDTYHSLWIVPLFAHDRSFDGGDRISILWPLPLYHRSSQGEALKIDLLAYLIQYRRSADQSSHETRLLWRFFAHRSEGGKDFWRIFFSPEFEW
ncbi:MAG: hypothetical protein V2A74_07135 [bacterium]